MYTRLHSFLSKHRILHEIRSINSALEVASQQRSRSLKLLIISERSWINQIFTLIYRRLSIVLIMAFYFINCLIMVFVDVGASGIRLMCVKFKKRYAYIHPKAQIGNSEHFTRDCLAIQTHTKKKTKEKSIKFK
jgi:hypothetical protein